MSDQRRRAIIALLILAPFALIGFWLSIYAEFTGAGPCGSELWALTLGWIAGGLLLTCLD